ncbi:hypothetical protein SAMN05444671_1208 [Flavobacterium sp. CF108]|uniref:hypothetical protein n=1 Tax=unclassified Flavobacterium TaxID=196869 RepID=UPI0008ABE45D|nr:MULTISPECIES: hypothetical protein [unclassified Flavobacterium]SEO85923.1 hypothetical protein SAMN04487978_3845 [Flavobacterium sp. fv08]SHG69364.1 hypothetical protein SAMN05444671_1208 [Flavobacterium sp. CF108]
MDIEKDLQWIHQEIDKIKNPNTIKKIKNLLESINYSMIRSSDSYNLDIENSLRSIKEGNIYTENQAKEIIFSKNYNII